MTFAFRTLVVAVVLFTCSTFGEKAGGWHEQPTGLPLTAGQVLATGRFSDCSGVLVTSVWVLSAAHCAIASEDMFCIGPETPNVCLRVRRVVRSTHADIALIELSESAIERFPGVEPVALFDERLDGSFLGRKLELAGYGLDATRGGKRARRFAVEPITILRADTFVVGGIERHGECYGGSGGPAFIMRSDGSVRVAGILSLGSPTCVGPDIYTRIDVHRKWIEEQTMTQ